MPRLRILARWAVPSALLLLSCGVWPIPVAAKTTGEEFTWILGYHLGSGTTLPEIMKVLGQAPVVESGDASEYEMHICYKAKEGYVEFLTGEMGDSSRELLGFLISKAEPHETCPPLPARFFNRPLHTGPLNLGMKRRPFLKATEIKEAENAETYSTSYSVKQPMTGEEKLQHLTGREQDFFDASISLEATFIGEDLSTLNVWKIVSR